MPDRSFFIKGHQFPVCARCTGVLIGYILGIALHFLVGTYIVYCVIACAIMFIDWYIQYLEIKMSTNIRRFITGILGGYGIIGIQIIFVKFIAQYL